MPSHHKQLRLRYADSYETAPIDENLIVYETRDGKSLVDSPLAICRYLTTQSGYEEYKHVWIIDPSIEGIKESLPDELYEKVIFVDRGTFEYVDYLLQAKYIISNATLETFFVKRPGQVYINTWHGTPLKYMGFDIPGNPNHSQNVLRNFLMTDYILSPNEHTSNIFINKYKLKGIYPGEILEGGYPRIDRIFNADPKEVKETIKSYGTSINDKPILLFCPTWKGTSIHHTSDDIDQIVTETLDLVKSCQADYSVLLKVHPFVYQKIKEDERVSSYLVSDLIDACDVMRITDLLITDYSSIFFDFLVTGKPIIFYTWDKDLYKINRGMYFDEAELPGPVAENLSELKQYIYDIKKLSPKYQATYAKLSAEIVPYENGQVTKKYVDYIFDKKNVSNMIVHHVDSNKKKILMYPGGMHHNGITSSALNLINNIDYTKYDVTVILNSKNNLEAIQNIEAINSNARLMFRFGTTILTKEEEALDRQFNDNGILPTERSLYPTVGYKREMNRITANLEFDSAIDFSGYSYFWARHILAANAKMYAVFMHNDLVADSQKEINGKMPRFKDLNALFSIYYKFDRLLSVSPMTRDVNLEKLGDRVTPEQMSYVYNTININRMLKENHSKEEVKGNSSQIKLKTVELQAIKSCEVPLFINIDAIDKQKNKTVYLEKDDKIVQQAEYTDCYQRKYVKTILNNIYIGWIPREYVEPKEFVIESIEPYYSVSTVARQLNFPIWKDIRKNSETDVMLTHVRYFKNRYLETDQIAYTSNGRYYRVKYNGEILGWVTGKPLKRHHKLQKNNPLMVYFRSKQRYQEKKDPVGYTTLLEKVDLYAVLNKDEEFALYTEPVGTTKSEIKDINQADYEGEVFHIIEKAWVTDGVYCRMYVDGRFFGYIKEESIRYVSQDIYLEKLNEKKETELVSLPKYDLAGQKLPEFDPSIYNVINMGRLSPEKNQGALISAFAKFNADVPNSRLYILGKGPLESDLINHIIEEQVEGKVFLLGHIKNPFAFIERMDAFVLPSIYEGQPMVLLESMVLNLNILASNIPANINVLGVEEKHGLLTKGTEVNDIYEGLKRIYSYTGSFEIFDYESYNKLAIDSFYREIDG